MDKVSILNQALFEIDPLNTSCKENDCFDEYQQLARLTIEAMEEGASFVDALYANISMLFYEDAAAAMDYAAIENRYESLK